MGRPRPPRSRQTHLGPLQKELLLASKVFGICLDLQSTGNNSHHPKLQGIWAMILGTSEVQGGVVGSSKKRMKDHNRSCVGLFLHIAAVLALVHKYSSLGAPISPQL